MSKSTKRKHVFNEILQGDFTPPLPNHQIVRIVKSRGNNLHEVEASNSTNFLISMPNKFRKNVWIKKGDYVIVEPIEEGDKVKAEMVKPLSEEYIKYLKSENLWPPEFSQEDEKESFSEEENEETFVNPNRRVYQESTSEESE